MNRHTLTFAALMALGASAGAQTVLNVSTWLPPTHGATMAQNQWCEAVEKGTNGSVKCNLLPKAVSGLLPNARALNLRASVNLYRSKVAAVAGPDNRLDGQQPWSANFGFDRRLTGAVCQYLITAYRQCAQDIFTFGVGLG